MTDLVLCYLVLIELNLSENSLEIHVLVAIQAPVFAALHVWEADSHTDAVKLKLTSPVWKQGLNNNKKEMSFHLSEQIPGDSHYDFSLLHLIMWFSRSY